MVTVGKKAFCIQGCGTAGSCCSDGLTIAVIDDIAGSENAELVGGGGGVLDLDVALVVEINLSREQFRAGIMPNGDEQARGIQV